ncbi:platelet binding protein GspB-like [Odontomachus brunneus]|uniref:platelet binding protein GspB-like n=1 Tax=Odontomachus brunneus TaxID=486640 RepID=UPI0013F221A8|nr:platelet binding protein GspB-like [Odontomachus brunneus]
MNVKILSSNSQISNRRKSGQKLDHISNKGRASKLSIRTTTSKDATFAIATSANSITAGKINSSKKSNGNNDGNFNSSEQHTTKNASIVSAKQHSSSTFSSMRAISTCVNSVAHENPIKPKDYAAKKFPGEADSSINNYPIQSDYKEVSVNNPDYKSRNSGSGTSMSAANLPLRFATQSSSSASTSASTSASASALHRENHTPSSTSYQSGAVSRNDNSAFAVARKALEQQSSTSKMAPTNFPPLRAPQSIVNVRHPLLTDARTKHSETVGSLAKSKLNVMSSLQSGVKDLDQHGRQTFHGYGTSSIASIPSVQNLNNAVTASISPYPRSDPFPQPTVTSVLFSDTAQFPQSPPYNTTQLSQLNQYQTYDPSSFATTPVNVNPVMPQFSTESSIPYPQYENPPQFVQPNHYPTADMTNSQYQYQTAGVGQIQDSSMFIQSLQSPIAVTDQYAASNYARTVRTELIPHLRRPSRFNK